ncbi:MAG: M20/M25/M40 family metallo-hydrolase [Candidatus Doudnabacteria bacterium]|nr:M20/M25/M40 family metallo-hydrolase [Candidatus Doudnabacteria bacterium]
MRTFLKKILAIPSVSSDLPQLQVVTDYVQGYLEEKGFTVKRFEKNGKPSIIAFVGQHKSKHFKVILNGHLDVVAASTDEFKVREKDGKLFARGASDMKGVVAGMIDVFTQLVAEGKGEGIALMLTTDEEVGGFNGVDYLLNEEGYSCDVAFIPDGGDNWQVCSDEKAVLFANLKAKGVGAHGSRPWQGVNAVEKLLAAYTQIRVEFEGKWGTPTAENYWIPTINLGKIQGGDSTNKVAEQAEMNVDIRFPASVSKADIEKVLTQACTDHGVSYSEILFGDANHTDESNDFILSWRKLVEQNGHKVKFWKACGGSDGRFFSAKKIPVVMSKPICSEPHIEGEWIDLESLDEWCKALKAWLTL